MRITINGEPAEVEGGTTVAALVASREIAHRAFAVEVNRRVIPRRDHEAHELNEGDAVEIVTLVGGG